MNIIIRTDASRTIGSGHVMRCLTIAKALQKRGGNVRFFMKELPGHLIDYVEKQGFKNIHEAIEAELYIIDHYDIDAKWEREIRNYAKKVMVIDDLANREHDCDLLLDQNILPDFEKRYEDLVPIHCVKLLGPKYLIMRDEFIKARMQIIVRNFKLDRLLIFMGGTDPTNETLKVLHALDISNYRFKYVDVIVGDGNVNKIEIESICIREGYYFHSQIDYIAKLMVEADFSIGAGGSTTWERCYVGLPSSSTIVAENQRNGTEIAARYGSVWNLGWHEDIKVDNYVLLINELPKKRKYLKEISAVGLELTGSTAEPNPWIEKILEMMR